LPYESPPRGWLADIKVFSTAAAVVNETILQFPEDRFVDTPDEAE
jgi:hypothetical protein